MKRVAPDSIALSRVYFTEFDRVTYSQVAWTSADVEGIRRDMERKLKLVALVKGHVVIAASRRSGEAPVSWRLAWRRPVSDVSPWRARRVPGRGPYDPTNLVSRLPGSRFAESA